jgi:glycosyltransferase involved in cell wall biosynthesis
MAERGDKVRVVVVVSHLGLGGAERQTLDLLRQLRGTAWAPVGVICLSTNVSPYGDAVRALGYPLSIVHRASGFDFGRCLALHRLLRRDEADVVHAVNWFASGYSVLAKPRGARVISSIRNSHLPRGRVRQSVLTRLIRRSDGVLVNSDRGRQLVMQTCKVPSARVALVPNGIDVDLLHSTARPGAFRQELSIPADAPVVAYVGRNARVKNIPRLLGVVRSLLQASPDVRIVLAGEGLGPGLVAGTDLAAVPRLSCLGPRRDIPSLLRDATVLILTSDNEGMPNVVLEALAAGLPVVATDVGDLAHMLPQSCGALVPPDIEPLASAVLRVIAHASLYRRAAEQHAASVAATYSSQAMANRTVNVWRALALHVNQPGADLLTNPLDPVC